MTNATYWIRNTHGHLLPVIRVTLADLDSAIKLAKKLRGMYACVYMQARTTKDGLTGFYGETY